MQLDRPAIKLNRNLLLRSSRIVLVCAALACASIAAADVPDWGDVSALETVTVVTETQEGEAHESTIWLVMVDGKGYIRTTERSGWGKNIRRNSTITIRVAGVDHPVSVTFVDDTAEFDRVDARFREKYGFRDALVGIVRGSNPPMMRLDAREGDGN